MAEKSKDLTERKKPMFSLDVYEVQDGAGGKDHLIEAGIRTGALNFQFEATVDQIREFFTERREKQKQIAK